MTTEPSAAVTPGRAPGVQASPPPTRARAALHHAGVLALFTALTVLATWPLARMAWWGTLDYGDTLTSAYSMAWQAHALATAPAHFFDANIMYPFPLTLTFDELNFAPALLGAPIYWLTGNTILDYNFVTLLSFVVSGYGCWLLVRELTGSSRAGIVAGVAFAFSFFRFDNLTHITILNVQWLPLVLLWLHRLWTRPRPGAALAFGLFFALQALSSHYLAFYTLGTVGLFVVFHTVAEHRLHPRFLAGVAGGLALAAVPLVPIAAGYLTGQNGGFHRPLWDIDRYTATLGSYFAVYTGNPLYKALLAPFADPGTWPWERSLFPGLVAPLLALGAGAAAWRARGRDPAARLVWFYALLAGMALILSFGPELIPTFTNPAPVGPLPYMLLYQFVPGVQTMRVITRIVVLFSLGLSVLAGFGVARLLAARRLHPGVRRAAPVVLSGLLLLETWSAPVSMVPLAAGADIPPVYRWLATQPPDTVVLEYPMLYFQRGPRNVAMINQYEYYGTYDWLRTPNGAMTVRPPAWTALTAELEKASCFFPCPRSLDVLWALGVPLAAVHLDNLSPAQRQDFLWRSTAGRDAGLYPGEFVKVADFGADAVYRIDRRGPHPLSELRQFVRPGARLVLGKAEADPEKTGAYVDALAYWLRDLREYGDPERSFGQAITAPAGTDYDYALLYPGEDPAPYGFTPDEVRWHNDYVLLYGHR